MSDTYEPSIWPRVNLGDGTVAKLAPSGMVKLEQTIGGELEIMYLSPDQVALLYNYLHQAAIMKARTPVLDQHIFSV